MRAPTPSAAAEIAVFDYNLLINTMNQKKYKLDIYLRQQITAYQNRVKSLSLRLNYLRPDNKINIQKQRIADLLDKLNSLMEQKVVKKRNRMELLLSKLESFNPADKLEKGFAYVINQGNVPITDLSAVHIGEELKLILSQGEIEVKVQNINKKVRKEVE